MKHGETLLPSAAREVEQRLATLKHLYIELQRDGDDCASHREACRLLLAEGALAVETLDLPFLDPLLEILFSRDFVRHQQLAKLTLSRLKSRHRIGPATEGDTPARLCAVARDRLFLLAMRKTFNVDFDIEVFLRDLRGHLLLGRLASGGLPGDYTPLLAALAEQCFNNEYILCEEEEEQRALRQLTEELVSMAKQGEGVCPEMDLMLLAAYRPLHLDPAARRVALRHVDRFSREVYPTIKKILLEPIKEERLAPLIPSFGTMACPTSRAVQTQYEENPYPRWFVHNRPRNLEKMLNDIDPSFAWPVSFTQDVFRILVPGCGTGQHPIALAWANPAAHVLAVDLSKASLAYAKRMAEKYRIGNISFLQGDLLDLPSLDLRFHHIDCGGVLHHLRDPLRGWCALDAVLIPGGTMHIAVYGKAARMHLQHLQTEIQREGIPATPEAMKRFRQQIFTDKYRLLRDSFRHNDLFYLSGFRDALFHACEHVFTLSEIQSIIERSGHRFLGFKANSLRAAYKRLFPDDPRMNSFANWKKFEPNYAGSGNMFSFLVQKTEV